MPQLDRLLAVMASSQAAALRLADGEPACVVKEGVEHPITRRELEPSHVLTLMREVAPPGLSAAVAADGGRHEFEYATSEATYRIVVQRAHGRLSAEVTFAGTPVPAPDGDLASGEDPGPLTSADPSPTIATSLDSRAAAARGEVETLLRHQASVGASDLHLRSGSPPILRLHGRIERDDKAAPLSAAQVEAMLASVMPERNRDEFAESNDTDFAYELAGSGRFRVNAFRDRHGVALVARLIPSRIVTAEELGLSPEVQALCNLTKGLVLVTGPTGSGKSTTLCALVDLVNRTRRDHIVTIEDPIEFVHESKGCLVTQRQVGLHTGSFKGALRAALREDPDVVLVGELRDLETVSIAIETAETGHLVFATMHTSTAASTIDRIIDQFPADRQGQVRVMLSESLKGVIAQTLCRKIGGGRVAAMEVLLTTPALSNLIREAKTFQIPSVIQTSRKVGMVTLNDALLDLVEKGLVDPREAYLKAVDKAGLVASLKARGVDVSFVDGADPAAGAARGDAAGLRPGAPRPPGTVRR